MDVFSACAVFILALFNFGCSIQSSQPNKNEKFGSDVYVTRLSRSQELYYSLGNSIRYNSTESKRSGSDQPESKAKEQVVNLDECRQKIAKIVCWVDPTKEGDLISDRDRSCLPGSEKFAAAFEGHFDRSPDFIQKMYCHLDRLWIEKSFIGSAYANPVVDSQDRVVVGAVGIRQELLENPPTLDEWLSWKDETNFGGRSLMSGPRLGIINYKSNRATKEFFLDYLMNHEFGHLFDFANNLNQVLECEQRETSPGRWEDTGICALAKESWGSLTWKDNQTPLAQFDFPFQKEICFYFCEGKFISADNAVSLFSGLIGSGFPSIYAARNPMEDWAEAFALTVAHRDFGLNYGVKVKDQYFDLTAHFNSEKIRVKREYVLNFLAKSFIYPGEMNKAPAE